MPNFSFHPPMPLVAILICKEKTQILLNKPDENNYQLADRRRQDSLFVKKSFR